MRAPPLQALNHRWCWVHGRRSACSAPDGACVICFAQRAAGPLTTGHRAFKISTAWRASPGTAADAAPPAKIFHVLNADHHRGIFGISVLGAVEDWLDVPA